MIREILEEAYQVNLTMKTDVAVEPGEYPDITVLEGNENKLFKFVTDYLRREFIERKVAFPKDGMAEVEFGIDMVCLKGEDYRKLMKRLSHLEVLDNASV